MDAHAQIEQVVAKFQTALIAKHKAGLESRFMPEGGSWFEVLGDDAYHQLSAKHPQMPAHADMRVVGECADGEAALAAMRELRPDLVLIDVQMPAISGLDVLERLSPQERPLAILLTAHAQFALRALVYLLKPIDEDRFADALDRARQAPALRLRDGSHCAPAAPMWMRCARHCWRPVPARNHMG